MQQFMQMTQPYIELTALDQIPNVILQLKEQLQQWGIAEETQTDLKLCMMEALQNALLYAGSDVVAARAKVMWEGNATAFCFTVEDNGNGIPLKMRSVPQEASLEENGRGLLLMHAILDEVNFNEQGNRITGILHW